MLCQFSVKNYKSFRDDMTLDMSATDIPEHPDRIINTKDGENFLPITVIYGPNGGGKSNVLNALYTLVAKVLAPIGATGDKLAAGYKNSKAHAIPFILSKKAAEEPTEFELYFRKKIAEYRYTLCVTHDFIVSESLSSLALDNAKESVLFTRDKESVVLESELSEIQINEKIPDNLPLLSYLGIEYSQDTIVSDIISWFELGIGFIDYNVPTRDIRMSLIEDKDLKSLMLDMIKEIGLDIIDFRIEQEDEEHIRVYTTHIVDGYSVELNLKDESSGTKKLFGLLPIILYSLSIGSALIIDELDSKIHPTLLRYIISLFGDMSINKRGAQLIFTSHDLLTMNGELLRKDEIWLVAKGVNQNSKLYSLVEFKSPRNNTASETLDYDKEYIAGKYGADPYVRRIVNWKVINA